MTKSTNYFIHLHNRAATRKRFVLYQADPLGEGSSVKAFGNIWLADSVSAGHDGKLTITEEFYAWGGTTEVPLSNGVTVSGGGALPVDLGTDSSKGSTIAAAVIPDPPSVDVELSVAPAEAGPGAYEIKIGKFTDGDTRVLIGLGRPDEHDTKLPVATFNPTPNQTYILKPILKAKVSINESGQVGQALDYSSISTFPGDVDFVKNPGKFNAVVTYSAEGEFSTSYY